MASATRGNKKERRGIAPPTFLSKTPDRLRADPIHSRPIEPFAGFERLIRRKIWACGFMGRAMADRAGLGFLGFILGGVTVAVMLVAASMVIGHIDGRFIIDTAPTQIAANE